MNKTIIENILKKYNLFSLEKIWYIRKLISSLSLYRKNQFIYPKDLIWLYREDKDYLYIVLDTLEKEKLIKYHIVLRCCKCSKEIELNNYLLKNEEITCEDCGADNDERDCMACYEVI